MSEASTFMPCDICGGLRPQVLYAPSFVEDRVRLWRGPLGNRYSTALGTQMPDSREARDRLARERGVEFVGKAEFLADNKEAQEAVDYHAHVQSGGKREDPAPPPVANWHEKPPAWAEPLLKQ